MSEEKKKNEPEEIEEEELEEVAGGIWGRDSRCYFEPEVPYVWYRGEGTEYIWVKCKMDCYGFILACCSCHGSGSECSNRHHKMQYTSGGRWRGYPINSMNHNEAGKVVHGISPEEAGII